MAATFSRWRIYGILVLKKLKVQLKNCTFNTLKKDKTIRNDERKYKLQKEDQGTALGA